MCNVLERVTVTMRDWDFVVVYFSAHGLQPGTVNPAIEEAEKRPSTGNVIY